MIREITDKQEWKKTLSEAPSASGRFLQSWEWGEFQKSFGRKVFRFGGDGGAAQVIELPLPSGKKYWFCPKGPISANGSGQALPAGRQVENDFLVVLKQEAKKAGVVFLRVEPAEAIAGGVKSRDINPSATSIIEIAHEDEEMLAFMHPKTRYNIRVSEKHKIRFVFWPSHRLPLDDVFGLFEDTAKRDNFRLHERAYYEKQVEMPSVRVFGAHAGDELLAAAIVISDGETATYLHGASSSEKRNMMAPYALHWGIIKTLRAEGICRYDLWGISDDPKSSWAGITRFKRGWGGKEVAAPGTFDLPISGFWYRVYRLARRLRP